jgi:hypothetical protein
MIRRLLPTIALLLLLASRAQAATINLLLTVDYNEPLFGPRPITLQYEFLESAVNAWKMIPKPPLTNLANGGATLLPGVTQFEVSLEASSLDDIYFKAWGDYRTLSPPFLGVYVAEPPTGPVPDADANVFGAPWIPLADLGEGFSGDFGWILGEPRPNGIGSWELAPAPAPVTAVPEPASLLLLGSGLAALARRGYRDLKGIRPRR